MRRYHLYVRREKREIGRLYSEVESVFILLLLDGAPEEALGGNHIRNEEVVPVNLDDITREIAEPLGYGIIDIHTRKLFFTGSYIPQGTRVRYL